jgi:hypothetical protein
MTGLGIRVNKTKSQHCAGLGLLLDVELSWSDGLDQRLRLHIAECQRRHGQRDYDFLHFILQ